MEQIFITQKFSLVPLFADNGHGEETHCSNDDMRDILSKFYTINKDDEICSIPVFNSKALLLYAKPIDIQTNEDKAIALPLAAKLIERIKYIPDHNKIIIHISRDNNTTIHDKDDSQILFHLAMQEGNKFLMINTFKITKFETALYYLLLAMKNAQLNTTQTGILSMSSLEDFEKKLLLRYFKYVEIEDIESNNNINIFHY